MRSTPTASQTGVYSISDGANNLSQSATNLTFFNGNTDGCFLQLGNFSSITQSRPNMPRFLNDNKITLSAEL